MITHTSIPALGQMRMMKRQRTAFIGGAVMNGENQDVVPFIQPNESRPERRLALEVELARALLAQHLPQPRVARRRRRANSIFHTFER